ncbi:helix-turn-helix domain-containing protein, partial [Streptomyces viridiviolaceus]
MRFSLPREGSALACASRATRILTSKGVPPDEQRSTGKRWRNGRNPSGRQKAAPPARPVVPPSGASRYLREADRIYIADRLLEKATVRAIAAELGRSPSTVSREIRRNRHPVNGQYRPFAAQARADDRR